MPTPAIGAPTGTVGPLPGTSSISQLMAALDLNLAHQQAPAGPALQRNAAHLAGLLRALEAALRAPRAVLQASQRVAIHEVLRRTGACPAAGLPAVRAARAGLQAGVDALDQRLAPTLARRLADPDFFTPQQEGCDRDLARTLAELTRCPLARGKALEAAQTLVPRPSAPAGLRAGKVVVRGPPPHLGQGSGQAVRRKMSAAERALVARAWWDQPAEAVDAMLAAVEILGLRSKWVVSALGRELCVARTHVHGGHGKGRRAVERHGRRCFIKELRLDVLERLLQDDAKFESGDRTRPLATGFTAPEAADAEERMMARAQARLQPIDKIDFEGRRYWVFDREMACDLLSLQALLPNPATWRDDTLLVGMRLGTDALRGHTFGVVNRDIKLENGLVDETGELVLIDYGAAGEIGADGKVHGIDGTADSAAPELFDAGVADPKADVFSLGIAMLTNLARTRLFPVYSPAEGPPRRQGTQAADGFRAVSAFYRDIHRAWAAHRQLLLSRLAMARLCGTGPEGLGPTCAAVACAFQVCPEFTELIVARTLDPNPKTRIGMAELLDALMALPDAQAGLERGIANVRQALARPDPLRTATYAWLEAQRAATHFVGPAEPMTRPASSTSAASDTR